MPSGTLPDNISLLYTLESIGENIIIADTGYNIVWFNTKAASLLNIVASHYGMTDANEFIGLNMGRFHRRPEHQEQMMEGLTESYRTRINIRGAVLTDTVITPIKNEAGLLQGYVIMLMDVTIQAQEEKKKDKLIHALSAPMIRIWQNSIALPLIGEFNQERADEVTEAVLVECTKNSIEYVIIDLSGLSYFDDNIKFYIQKLYDCLRLIGTTCILAGITPEVAMTAGELDAGILVFNNTHAGLKHILKLDQ